MPDNLPIKDGNSALTSLRTTEASGVHVPHHIALSPAAAESTLLNAVTAIGASAAFAQPDKSNHIFHVEGASSPAGVVVIEVRAPTGTWIEADRRTLPLSDGRTRYAVELRGRFGAVRANLTERTSGAFTVSVTSF
jgi:hypothetical protein